MPKPPIVNCHTHIFTADHVPPFLAKTYVPWPFYYLLPLGPIVAFFRWWYKGPATARFSVASKKWVKLRTAITAFFTRLYPFNILAGYYIFLFSFYLLCKLIIPVFPPGDGWIFRTIVKAGHFIKPIFPVIDSTWLKIAIVAIVFIYFKSVRNMLIFFANLVWKFLSKLPGKQTREMAARYLNIGRYAFHKKQGTILSKLKSQYPPDTRFVILPMDMDYMDAGKPKERYRDQMQNLAIIKLSNPKTIYPFVFADPRRMVKPQEEKDFKTGDKEYFSWSVAENGKIVLGDCFIKEYIESYGFSGIKIYPALGYYPFDIKLLPLWKYAVDNDIPVLTHCIRGTIFYRGVKKQDWNAHPVFQQSMEHKKNSKDFDGYKDDVQLENKDAEVIYEPLVLPQTSNVDFSYNFTNPMNYLCVLDENLLLGIIDREVQKNPGTELKKLFGYTDSKTPLKYNLRSLKLCLGHFGGDDEWKCYFEKDRYNYSAQLIKNPTTGIKFFEKVNGEPAKGKPEQLWKSTDWYSIICSMMLQYKNVYADISYILHSDAEILPLLKETLQNPGLKEKVLYGTDFFVVRNHKSDKNMLADMMGGLPEEEFDQIARINPASYLSNTLKKQ